MHTSKVHLTAALIAAVATLGACAPATATGGGVDSGPGADLYENHCLECHESTVHVRERHAARTFEEVQRWVRRWAQYRELDWNEDEIRAVSTYLNERYYRY